MKVISFLIDVDIGEIEMHFENFIFLKVVMEVDIEEIEIDFEHYIRNVMDFLEVVEFMVIFMEYCSLSLYLDEFGNL